jgi:uncharacterized membrane protein HdeD (DUF308 family)
MPINMHANENRGSRNRGLNDALGIAAVVGVFAALDVVGHSNTSYFWVKLAGLVAFSTSCLLLTRDRETCDVFFGVLGALSTMGAIAMTTASRMVPEEWWRLFLSFLGAAVLFTLLTRKKRTTLLGITAIVGFRLLIALVLYAARR